VQVSTRGGNYPLWRGDGRELFFLEGSRLMSTSVGPGTPLSVGPLGYLQTLPTTLPGLPLGAPYAPSPDGTRFLVLADTTSDEHSIKVTLNWAGTRRNGRS
jgi:hypothetical protein